MEVTDVKDNTITVRWSPAAGPISRYRVTGTPLTGEGPVLNAEIAPGILYGSCVNAVSTPIYI